MDTGKGKALFDEKGISYYLVGSHTDITEVKNTNRNYIIWLTMIN